MRKRATKKRIEKKETSVTRLPAVKPGKYADGLPLHEIQYLECKLMLWPNHFTSRKSFFDFAKVMRRPAAATKVEFSSEDFVDAPLQIREVLFVDTADFRFYNNAFILRRRIPYEDGFPVGDPEIVVKFLHPDSRADGRPPADLRGLPDQVQGRGPAAQGPARRNPDPFFTQRAVPVQPRARE